MTNTILDILNINVIFCRPGPYVTMKLGDAWIDMNDIFDLTTITVVYWLIC